MKQLSLRTGLLALLAFMTLLLLAVSFMGIVAINKGNRSLDVINRIQGIELNSLYQSNADLMRARANAALAVRKIEIGLLEEGGSNKTVAGGCGLITAKPEALWTPER